MEKFKVCERETKTKAFSKEGLSLDRTDPKNREKQRIREWVTECINSLRVQCDTMEAEVESLSKSKKKKGDNEKLASLTHRLTRHRYHIDMLERLLRAVDNENVSFEDAAELKESVEYYVYNNDDPDFVEDTSVYESLNLEKAINVMPASTISLESGIICKPEDSSSSRTSEELTGKTKATVTDTSASHSSNQKISSTQQPTGNKEVSPKTILSTKDSNNNNKGVGSSPRPSQPFTAKNYAATKNSGTSNPAATSSRSEGNVSVSSAWGNVINAAGKSLNSVNQSLKTSPPRRPFAAAVLEGLQSSKKDERSSSSETPEEENFSVQKQNSFGYSTANKSSFAESEKKDETGKFSSQVKLDRSANSSKWVPRSQALSSSEESIKLANRKTKQRMDENVSSTLGQEGSAEVSAEVSEGTPTLSGSNDSDRSDGGKEVASSRLSMSSSPSSPSIQGSYPPSKHSTPFIQNDTSLTEGVLGGAFRQEERAATQTLLDASLRCMPEPLDVDLPKNYIPRNPSKYVPTCFPTAPPPMLLSPSLFQHFDTDTLFFIFYFQPGTYQQYLAAKELKRQSWRFHRKYMTWFQRHEEPQVVESDYEQGTYVYFDYALNDDAGWCQRIKSEFTFEYAYLEDELPIDS
ncbi:CCR4-NOT transcription complex subunit 3 [Galdieria sulphuraria]|nr:CCR4-NOT transcription complex subunit 3 [Galdieria sulphuraria]